MKGSGGELCTAIPGDHHQIGGTDEPNDIDTAPKSQHLIRSARQFDYQNSFGHVS